MSPIFTHLLPSRFKKCGYCRLKCKSSSISGSGGLLSPYADDICSCGTMISCDRKVRFELCILTANESDVRSGGRVVNRDSRVIVKEHNLQRSKKREISYFRSIGMFKYPVY